MKKTKRVHIRISEKKQEEVKRHAQEKGMTITGMIRVALKKVFGIEI